MTRISELFERRNKIFVKSTPGGNNSRIYHEIFS